MNANTFDELCNDLFQSFLKNTPDYLTPLTQKYGQVELDNILQQAIDRVLGWIELNDISHFNDQTHDLVQMKAIQTLTGEFGGVLGVDVSVDADGGMMVGHELIETIRESMPADVLQQFEAECQQRSRQNPCELIDRQLGLDFFANLYRVAKRRIGTLNVDKSACYLNCLMGGMLLKNPQLRDTEFVSELIDLTTNGDKRNRLKKVLSRDTPPDIIDPGLIQIFVWEDILVAMGRANSPKDARGELLMCKEDLRSIAKVWKNDGGNMSIELLVDKLVG